MNNQITQISQLAEQIQNQINIYKNMLQNTAQLPNHVWGEVENDLKNLQRLSTKARRRLFHGNVDDVLKQRFQSFADMKSNLPDGASFLLDLSELVRHQSRHDRRILEGRKLTAEQFPSEESTMSSLRSMSETADGQMKALQVGHRSQPSRLPRCRSCAPGLAADDDDGHLVPVRAGTKGLAQAGANISSAEPSVTSAADRRWSPAGERAPA